MTSLSPDTDIPSILEGDHISTYRASRPENVVQRYFARFICAWVSLISFGSEITVARLLARERDRIDDHPCLIIVIIDAQVRQDFGLNMKSYDENQIPLPSTSHSKKHF